MEPGRDNKSFQYANQLVAYIPMVKTAVNRVPQQIIQTPNTCFLNETKREKIDKILILRRFENGITKI